MRRFLYITPYFPPSTRVGALRPAKFLRHTRRFGWDAVVLAAEPSSGERHPALERLVPSETRIVRDYSARGASPSATSSSERRWVRWMEARVPEFLNNPELIPLGEHLLDVPHALSAARRTVAAHPVDAVCVNADPFAGAVVGAVVARRIRKPLVVDFRDPWAWCDLRRPLRPLPSRQVTDRLERWVVQRASAVVLNTETAAGDYRANYPEIDPTRFHCIRNHGDADSCAGGSAVSFDRFTLLKVGTFRRFIEGQPLIDLLAELVRRGRQTEIQLVLAGGFPDSLRRMAERQGVGELLRAHPFVPYPELGSVLRAADVLVSVSARTRQRLPAKLYDYATCPRPILAIADNPELTDLCRRLGGAKAFRYDDVAAMADWVEAWLSQGRAPEVAHDGVDLSSRSATKHLCSILDSVTR